MYYSTFSKVIPVLCVALRLCDQILNNFMYKHIFKYQKDLINDLTPHFLLVSLVDFSNILFFMQTSLFTHYKVYTLLNGITTVIFFIVPLKI